MGVLNTDIVCYQSGPSNLGGAFVATPIAGTINNLFSNISGAEAAAGVTKYRCVYVKNNNAVDTLFNPKIYMVGVTPNANTEMYTAWGYAAVNAPEATIANETTAPAGITDWTSGVGVANAKTLAVNLAPSAYKAIWIKLVVTAGATASATDGASLAIAGETV